MAHTTKRKTIEEIKQAIECAEDLVGGTYRLISTTYQNNKAPLTIVHDIGGESHQFEMSPHMFVTGGRRCPHCRGRRISLAQRSSIEEFRRKVSDLVGGEYTVLAETYESNKTKLEMRHERCGRTFHMRPNDFLTKDRCPHCKADATGERLRHTPEKVASLFRQLASPDYELLDASGYKTRQSKIIIKHTVCGNQFRMAWSSFQAGSRCPWCAKNSPGELAILRYLEDGNIAYDTEFWFDDLRVMRPLRFDFRVTLQDGRSGLIEYDGFYHYGKGVFGHLGREIQERDEMKNAYCSEKGIPLLRISWEDYESIPLMLEEFLVEGSTTIPSGSTP